jgi:hypothetical protein
VVTSFTVAHCITLTLSLFGVVQVPPAVVEPVIAASIVVMAVLNLRQRAEISAHRISLVFACGLLHGLGFAAAIADLGLHGSYRAASVVGFNLGIELGQGMFLAAVLALALGARALQRASGQRYPALGRLSRSGLAQLASIFAAVVGAVWVVERLALR